MTYTPVDEAVIQEDTRLRDLGKRATGWAAGVVGVWLVLADAAQLPGLAVWLVALALAAVTVELVRRFYPSPRRYLS